MRAQFELLSDCPVCRIDGAVVEVYDPIEPSCALGLPAESRCRVCNTRWISRISAGAGAQEVYTPETGRCPLCEHKLIDEEIEAHACCMCGTRALMERVRESDPIGVLSVLEINLARFANEHGQRELGRFMESHFMGLTLAQVHQNVLRGARTETTFDALFGLIHHGGHKGNGAPSTLKAPRPQGNGAPSEEISQSPEDYEPRAMLLALVSVLMADGTRHPRETEFIDRFLAAESMTALRPGEIRVHQPTEISARVTPGRRAEVLELMAQLACIDGEADASEVRVLRSFAAAWGIGEEQVSEWIERFRWRYASDARRFLHRVRSFFVRE